MNQIATSSRATPGESTLKTMSSIELVAVINGLREAGKAELRHDNFMIKVEKVLGIDAPKFLGTQKYGNNISRQIYNLPKREAELMVMSESYAVQAQVYDRMTQLEAVADMARCKDDNHPAVRALDIFTAKLKGLRETGIDYDVAFRMANYAAFLATNVSFLSLDDLDTKMPEAPIRRAPSVRTAATTRAATPRKPEPKVSTEGFYTVEVLAKRKGTSVENVNILLEGNRLHMRMPNGEYVMKPAAQTKKVGMRRLGVNLWHDTAFR